MIFGAFSSPGHHFVENALFHYFNRILQFLTKYLKYLEYLEYLELGQFCNFCDVFFNGQRLLMASNVQLEVWG